MDPKPDELNNLQTLDAVCAWAGVSDATFLRPNEVLGGADTLRDIVGVPEHLWMQAVLKPRLRLSLKSLRSNLRMASRDARPPPGCLP